MTPETAQGLAFCIAAGFFGSTAMLAGFRLLGLAIEASDARMRGRILQVMLDGQDHATKELAAIFGVRAYFRIDELRECGYVEIRPSNDRGIYVYRITTSGIIRAHRR